MPTLKQAPEKTTKPKRHISLDLPSTKRTKLASRKKSPAGATALASNAKATEQTPNIQQFQDIITGKLLIGTAAIEVIREGYSAQILKAASRFFDVAEARIQAIACVPASTAHRLEKKLAKLDAAATERLFRLGMVTRMALAVFDNLDAAIDWMRQPNHALGNVAPMDLMDTEPGAAAVRQMLNAIETGGVA